MESGKGFKVAGKKIDDTWNLYQEKFLKEKFSR